ncbi:protein-disulfide reductase DsbD domain-containing protein [Methylobacterium sp. ID0610]|uniref:protein-disulfide reductase DsbD domain-containing protein n=1 Tax=Methylobacterium carpenticola TaxID=3344827 RepID=UPI0036CEBA4C
MTLPAPGRRRIRRASLALALALLACAGGAPARAASAWATGLHARARLVPGGQAGGVRYAGLEILLDRGFKTFWRDPGEAGMPPAIDWSASLNAAAVEVLWPVPRRMTEAGDVVFGYVDRVVLPIRVVPADARGPVSLRLRLDYGVCNDICIPVRADLSLTLPADAAAVGDPRVAEAVAAAPRPVRLGEGALTVLGAVPEPPGLAGRLFVAVRARVPSGDRADLFVSAPPGWLLLPPPRPRPEAPGTVLFRIPVLERPSARDDRLSLNLILASPGERPVTTEANLDTREWPR